MYTEAKRNAWEGDAEAAKRKFSEAEVMYESILAHGLVNWQVLYNLGNAFYQQGALGKAIASYRRAERLAPRREEIQFNLEKAKAEARDKEAPSRPPQWVCTLLFPYYQLNTNEVTEAGLAAYWAFAILLILVVFVRRAWAKCLCAIALAAAVVLAATLGAKVFNDQRAKQGVVTSEVCAVRLGHGIEYDKRFEVHEGAEFVVLGRYRDPRSHQEWLKVRLFVALRQANVDEEGTAAQAEGWVQAKDVELL